MPVLDGKNLGTQDVGEAMLAAILYPTREAQDEARERGRVRIERATMLAELIPVRPGATLGGLTREAIVPVG